VRRERKLLVYVNGSRVRRLLVQQGRKYRLAAIATDGSALYRGRHRGETDYWIRTGEGSELPWYFRSYFGRRRPLPPPNGDGWLAAAPRRVERRSHTRQELAAFGYLGLSGEG